MVMFEKIAEKGISKSVGTLSGIRLRLSECSSNSELFSWSVNQISQSFRFPESNWPTSISIRKKKSFDLFVCIVCESSHVRGCSGQFSEKWSFGMCGRLYVLNHYLTFESMGLISHPNIFLTHFILVFASQ